jgi:hypothetical protein
MQHPEKDFKPHGYFWFRFILNLARHLGTYDQALAELQEQAPPDRPEEYKALEQAQHDVLASKTSPYSD